MIYALSEADNGRILEVHVKDDLDLALRESRMSGYQWSVVESGEPFLSYEEIGTQSKPTRVGEPSTRAWRFTARQAGLARVTLRHARSWEPASSGSEFSLSVKISA